MAPKRALNELFNSANVVVLPSRGEGFNLPAAEAMAMGIPVIVTGFGGHTDFATTSTAWLIDYAFAPAVTHLSVPGSCWVEPKAAHLSQLMRVAWSESRTPCRARQRRIVRARKHVMDTYSSQAAGRVVHKFAARIVTDGAQRSSNTCRLAWMSTWHVNCGIAEYSRYLLQHISPDLFRTTVFADLRSEVTLSPPPTIRPVWSANEPSIIKTFDQIRHGGFDAVCIQHNFAFFGFDAVHCDALVKLQKKAPVFVTLHATRPLMSYDRDHLEVAKRALGSLERLIVHTTADLNILKTVGLVDNVVMIPQGVPERLPLIPASRADFGIPQSAFVVGSFGFLLKHKGIAELVSALPLIRSSTGKDVRLLLVNAFHDEIGGLKEKQRIDALIRSLNIGRWVVWMNEFLPIEQSKSYLAMADLLAFPYQHTFESSSAAVRMAISCDRPIVTTPLHIFSDFQTFVLRTRDMSVQNLAETISSAVRRPEQLTTNLSNQRSWADSMSWSRTGRRWEGMIKGCLTDHKSKLI